MDVDGEILAERWKILDSMPDLMTTGQVAQVFHVTPTTVRRWVARGLIKSANATLTDQLRRKYRKAHVASMLDRLNVDCKVSEDGNSSKKMGSDVSGE